jgi:hypothetical protein
MTLDSNPQQLLCNGIVSAAQSQSALAGAQVVAMAKDMALKVLGTQLSNQSTIIEQGPITIFAQM